MKVTKVDRTTDIFHLISGEADKAEDEGKNRYGSDTYVEFNEEKTVQIGGKVLIPFHAIDHIETSLASSEVDRKDPYCGDDEPVVGDITFEGIQDPLVIDAASSQGNQYDTTTGVKAYEDGVEIPFTATPRYLQVCDDEEGTVTYSAKGVSQEVDYQVHALLPPEILGVHDIKVGTGDTFNPLAGVSGVSAYGENIPVTCDAQDIYHEAGVYTATYTATDKCGRTTTATATITVADDEEVKTVLYNDGRFVVNQRVSDIVVEDVIAEYPPLDADNPYIFNGVSERPWFHEAQQIYYAGFGTPVAPESMAHWFAQCRNLESISWINCDTSKLTSLRATFASTGTEIIALPEMPKLETIRYMCHECLALHGVYLNNVNAQNIIDTTDAFKGCVEVEQFDLTGLGGTVQNCERMFANSQGQNDMVVHTIYTSPNLDFSQAQASSNMFRSCRNLVGAIPFNENYTDKTYANLQGYFTAK